ALKISERLKGYCLEAESFHHPAHLSRRPVERQEIVLEHLHAFEPGRGDSLQLFIENATEAHRGNGSLHAMAPQSTSMIDRSDRRRSFSRIDALDGGLNTTPIDAVAGAPQTARVLDVRRSGPAHTKPSPQSSLVFSGAYLWRPSVGR